MAATAGSAMLPSRGGISSEPLTIQGPSGQLEAIVDRPREPATAVAVVCHPHPLHHGTMHNKVTHTLARNFTRRGGLAVRFNFRGVGGSAGRYAGGDGETDDAAAVIEWAVSHCPGAPLYLAGFSFGAMVSIRVAASHDVAALVTVAPAIRFLRDNFVRPECPWLVIQGLDDEIVAAADARAWCGGLDPAPMLHAVPGVGHFFHGALRTIDAAIDAFFSRVPKDAGLDSEPQAC